jgi:Deacetylase PdaC/Protein of unknown function (DUF3298)
MKDFILFIVLSVIFVSCSKELTFENRSFEQKTTLPCKENCPYIRVKIPVAKGNSIVADSINKKIFSVLKGIIYFGEKPFTSSNYTDLLDSFIGSYEKMQRQFPEDTFGWEGDITGSVLYQSEHILNIQIQHYTFTGGAHGYDGLRSLVFDLNNGKIIPNAKLFKDWNLFKAFAEKKFRLKYKIPEQGPINATGYQFENEVFQLPQNIFYTDKGLLLHYNQYEAASYADGPKELFFPYAEINEFLAIR